MRNFTFVCAVIVVVAMSLHAIGAEDVLTNEISNNIIRCTITVTIPPTTVGGAIEFVDTTSNTPFATVSYDGATGFHVFPKRKDTLEVVYTFHGIGLGVDTYSILPDVPFVLVTRSQIAESGTQSECQLPTQTATFSLAITPDEAKNWKSFGTAGLKSVDGHKGSYGFLAMVQPSDRSGIVSGWITQRTSSGTVFSAVTEQGVTLKSMAEYGNSNVRFAKNEQPDIFAIGKFADCRIGLEQLADTIAAVNHIQLKPQPGAGYCTWYSNKYGGACDEKHLVELTDAAVEKLVPFGFDFVQIDDKWQLGVKTNGPKKNFTGHDPRGPYPSGMKPTAEMIRKNGLLAGIWFMPFAGNVSDSHFPKEWYVQSGVTDEITADGKSKRKFSTIVNKEGEPYESYWGGTSLDMSHPDVQKYLTEEVTRIYSEWGYNYFKLDGIWTAMATDQMYINNEFSRDDYGQSVFHSPTMTPMQAYRKGYELIRAAAPTAFILGCNVSQNMRTMAGSYGLVDAMRIGPDNGSSWNSLKRGPWTGSNRYFFHSRVWYNDPDPVYVRDTMPLHHAQLIASWVSISGQLYTFSDWLPELSAERVEVLQKTIPSHGRKTVQPVDLFDTDCPRIWHLWDDTTGTTGIRRDIVALYNWDSKETTITETASRLGLPPAKEYVVFDFWDNSFVGTFSAEEPLSFTVPAETCRILAVRPVEDHPIVLSTSCHVTQGMMDIITESWNGGYKILSGKSWVIKDTPYQLRVYVPKKYQKEDGSEPILRHDVVATETGEVEWFITFP